MEPEVMKKSVFNQQRDLLTSQSKDRVRTVYYARAMKILKSKPFVYSDSVCEEVSSDILDNGAKLMTNASVESNDDKEMNELNDMGDTFRSLQDSTCQFVTVDDNNHDDDEAKVKELIPMPTQPRYNVKRAEVTSFVEWSENVKKFIRVTATRSYSATIVILGEYTEDGVVFGNGTTFPRDVMERQVSQMLNENPKHCPLALYVVFTQADGEISVSTVTKGAEVEDCNVKRCIVKKDD